MKLSTYQLFENTLLDYLLFAGILVTGLLLKRLLSTIISKRLYFFLRQNNVPLKTCIDLLRKPVESFFVLITVYVAVSQLHPPASWGLASVNVFGISMVIWRTFQFLLISSIAWVAIRSTMFITLVFIEHASRHADSKLDDVFIPFIKDLVVVTICLIAFLAILGIVFHVDVLALVTGLGIGGLAIALAARETLENLLASFMILLDSHFVIGDTIQGDKISGEVEKIGFRSTRLRTPDGSLITVPNRVITAQAIENMTQRNFRKGKIILKLKSDTPGEQLKALTLYVQQLLENHASLYAQDRGSVRFETIGDGFYEIAIIFNTNSSGAALLNDVKQEFNYVLLQYLNDHKISLATPATPI
jgi:MscS family membrane protein